jgi:pimeloyl-ACP methyl ester carboxylesterase
VSEGFDLAGYNSVANAEDLADLRLALGYSEWNLYSISYGTRTALETLRGFPQGIRSVILDSPIPPQIDKTMSGPIPRASALSSLFATCKADPACSHDYPNLETTFDELLQQVAQSPIELAIRDPFSGEHKQIWLTGGAVFLAISQMLVNPVFIQIAPITIEQIHAGNTKVLQPLFPALVPTSNLAITYSVWCHDRSPSRVDDNQAALERYSMLKSFFAEDEDVPVCAVWGASQERAGNSEPVSSDIPALVMTGGHDPLTPPAYARLTATTLSHSYLYEFSAYGHAVSSKDCPKAMLVAFVDNPSSAPDSTCMAQVKERPFITDVYLNPGVFDLYTAVQLFDLRLSIARWPTIRFCHSLFADRLLPLSAVWR